MPRSARKHKIDPHPVGVARFLLVQYTNTRKIYQIAIKYTKWQQNISNGRKKDQISKKLLAPSIARPSKIYPIWDFWFENLATLELVTAGLGFYRLYRSFHLV
jgi:hypothetical protein